jgi:hypothetical protein
MRYDIFERQNRRLGLGLLVLFVTNFEQAGHHGRTRSDVEFGVNVTDVRADGPLAYAEAQRDGFIRASSCDHLRNLPLAWA